MTTSMSLSSLSVNSTDCDLATKSSNMPQDSNITNHLQPAVLNTAKFRHSPGQALPTNSSESSLLRMFECGLFSLSMTIEYLFRKRDLFIQAYLANRLFSFPNADVDFFLPQLVIILHCFPETSEYLTSYLMKRASQSVRFAAQLIWLIETISSKEQKNEDEIVNNLPIIYADSSSTSRANKFPSSHVSVSPITNAGGNNNYEYWLANGGSPKSSLVKVSSEMGIRRSSEDLKSLDRPDLDLMPSRFAALSRPDIPNVIGRVRWIPSTTIHTPINGTSLNSPIDQVANFKHKRNASDLTSIISFQAQKESSHRFYSDHQDPITPILPISHETVTYNDDLWNRNLKTLASRSDTHLLFPPKASSPPPSIAIFSNRVFSLCPQLSRLCNRLQEYVSSDLMKTCCATQWDFVFALLSISRRLAAFSCKERRTGHLQAELAKLNLNLPSRVWLPVDSGEHMVLRIPPSTAVCLNSAEKAPFLVFFEVLACDDVSRIALPPRSTCYSGTASSNLDANRFNHLPYLLAPNGSSMETAKSVAAPDLISLFSMDSSGSSDDQRNNTSQSCIPVIEVGDDVQRECKLRSMKTKNGQTVLIKAVEIRRRLEEKMGSRPHRAFKLDPLDPSAAVLKEPWNLKSRRIQESSPWGYLPGWQLSAVIVKVGDDLRQEQLAYQLLNVLKRIWTENEVELWLRPLNIVVTSADSGLIELVADTVSLHQIRRHAHLSLKDYIIREHGSTNSEGFLNAQKNFVQSCAAYCIVGYLFQVKDRHNGNILIDKEGHVIHIDYGYMLSASPGKNLGFEMSHFKLTIEQVELMGGVDSDMFRYYKLLILQGLTAASKHMEELCLLVEMALIGHPHLCCFAKGRGSSSLSALRQRFKRIRTETDLQLFVTDIVNASLRSVTTRLYDSYQYYTNGIQ